MSASSKASVASTGGDAVARALEGAGIRIVFGVASVHNLPIFDALTRSSIRLVPTRTESGAVNMADAYARVGGGIGVAITSTGTGAGNAAGAMIEALSAGSRMLHLTGQVESAYLGRGCGYIHETKDQLGMLEATSKHALQAERGAVGQAVAEAMQAIVEFPQGPVSVEIPIDFQYDESAVEAWTIVEPARTAPDPSSVRAAADALGSGRRVVVWAGGGVNASQAGAELRELVERTGAALLTSNKGRGAVPEDHHQCVGNFGSHPLVQAFLRKADVLLSVGTHFRSNETHTYALPFPAVHIQVDVDPAAIGRTFPASHGVVGDARSALGALTAELGAVAQVESGYLTEIEALRDDVRRAVRGTLGPYEEIVDALAMHVGPNGVLVRDVTVLANVIANRLHGIDAARSNIYAVGGGIGQGLAMAIGARLADGDAPLVLLAGDGGFAVNVGEMLTAVQERLRLAVCLYDDGGYGVLRNTQDAAFGGRRIGVDLTGPDFAALARSAGWSAIRVTQADEIAPALGEALAAPNPAMIVHDLTAIGPMSEPFLPPVKTGR
jgi:acetolactate synthase-1/2/3 large subunit